MAKTERKPLGKPSPQATAMLKRILTKKEQEALEVAAFGSSI
jgi:hypothetical protein